MVVGGLASAVEAAGDRTPGDLGLVGILAADRLARDGRLVARDRARDVGAVGLRSERAVVEDHLAMVGAGRVVHGIAEHVVAHPESAIENANDHALAVEAAIPD